MPAVSVTGVNNSNKLTNDKKDSKQRDFFHRIYCRRVARLKTNLGGLFLLRSLRSSAVLALSLLLHFALPHGQVNKDIVFSGGQVTAVA